jgi:4-hydroxy-tetrahydrodipicolinate synthase
MSRYLESKEKYQGVFIAAPAPMKVDGSLDLGKIQACVDFVVEGGLRAGTAVYVALGAGGEHMHLTKDERKALTEATVQASAGRIPVFVGASDQSTANAVELAQHAQRVGADGHLIETPWYFSSTADDAFHYYRAISEAVDIGITVYPTPWTSGLDMDEKFVERLAALDNVIGLKWYSGNPMNYTNVIRRFRERFSIVSNFSGAFHSSSFILGVRGYVSQGANFLPRTHSRILGLLRGRQYEQATDLYLSSEWIYYQAMVDAMREGYGGEGNFIKACMPLVGIECGSARLPLRPLPAWFVERVRQMLEAVGELAPAVAR